MQAFFTLLCVTVSPWTSTFMVQAHDDRVRTWCMWLPWISRSVCAIGRPCRRTAWRQWKRSIGEIEGSQCDIPIPFMTPILYFGCQWIKPPSSQQEKCYTCIGGIWSEPVWHTHALHGFPEDLSVLFSIKWVIRLDGAMGLKWLVSQCHLGQLGADRFSYCRGCLGECKDRYKREDNIQDRIRIFHASNSYPFHIKPIMQSQRRFENNAVWCERSEAALSDSGVRKAAFDVGGLLLPREVFWKRILAKSRSLRWCGYQCERCTE